MRNLSTVTPRAKDRRGRRLFAQAGVLDHSRVATPYRGPLRDPSAGVICGFAAIWGGVVKLR